MRTHSGTGNPLRIVGWEAWDVDDDREIVASLGWFDAEDYARRAAPA